MPYFPRLRFIQAWKMYDRIPMKSKSILPDEGFPARLVDLTDKGDLFPVFCLPKPNKGYAKHRVMVQCSCGRTIPFGRMGQHFNASPCREARIEAELSGTPWEPEDFYR